MKPTEAFSIGFISDEPEIQDEGWLALRGEIRLGDHREQFLANLELWSRERYEAHWKDAGSRIIAGAESTVFVTSAFQFWWPMWRSEHHLVVHEHLLMSEDGYGRPFQPNEDLFAQVGLYRGPLSESGERVSEWYITTHDVARWLDGIQEAAGPA